MRRISKVASVLNEAAERVRLSEGELVRVAARGFGCHAIHAAQYASGDYCVGVMDAFRKAAVDFGGVVDRSINPWWSMGDKRRVLALKAAALATVSEEV